VEYGKVYIICTTALSVHWYICWKEVQIIAPIRAQVKVRLECRCQTKSC
jgi:hypothetical protein